MRAIPPLLALALLNAALMAMSFGAGRYRAALAPAAAAGFCLGIAAAFFIFVKVRKDL